MRVIVRGILSLAALTLLASGNAAAQQHKGDKEVQLFFTSSYTKTNVGGFTGSTTSTTLGLIFGYFFTAPLEVRIGMVGTGSSSSGGGSTGVFSFTPGVTYSFISKSKTVPYLGVDAYFTSISSPGGSVSNSSVRPNVGGKYFISRNAAVDMNVGYTSYTGVKVLDERIGVVIVF